MLSKQMSKKKKQIKTVQLDNFHTFLNITRYLKAVKLKTDPAHKTDFK